MGVEAAEATGAVPHGVMAVEVAADEDPEPGTGAAAGLLGQLQGDEVSGHDVVAPDDALILDAEDLVEGDAPEGDERRGGIGGRPGELRIEGRQEAVAQVPVGGADGGDPDEPELVHEAALQGAIGALTAPPGLGGIAQDVLDAEPGQGPADLGGMLAITRPPAVGVCAAQWARSV